MGKGSGLAILALLIGIGGLGFGIYSYFTVNQTLVDIKSQINNSWYDVEKDPKSVSTSSYTAINDISLSVNIGTGETLHVLFTCTARIDGYIMYLRMYLDGIYTEIEAAATRTDTVGGYVTFSIAMQYINDTLSGTHIITIWGLCDDSGSYIYDSTLFAQTL
ncbi:MAG: hypothetical protein ACFFDH_08105 [Promethearchaeota archaeon]